MAADADERRLYCGIDPGASLSDKFVRRLLAASSNERFHMNLPSKDKLKEKYGITNDDFDVLTNVGEFLGAPAWLWKSLTGVIFAVILMASGAVGDWNNLKPIASYTAKALYSYVASINFIQPPKGSVVFVPPRHATKPQHPRVINGWVRSKYDIGPGNRLVARIIVSTTKP